MLGRQILAGSRYFLVIAVFGSFLSAIVLIVYGAMAVVKIAWMTFSKGPGQIDLSVAGVEHLAVEFIQLIDVFLLGTVFYIVALGLYELFLDPALPVPSWLQIHDLDELKEKMVGVTIVLLGVTFLGQVVEWEGDGNILALGVAIALVITALGLVVGFSFRRQHHRQPTDEK